MHLVAFAPAASAARGSTTLRRLGRQPIGVTFSSRPNNPRYHNKRAEMYFEAIRWIKNGGALPGDGASDDLIAALSQTTYTFRGDRLLLEPKEQLKARLGCSPDDADAFALTFAQPVAARPVYADRTKRRSTAPSAAAAPA
jgi:hypothetical protein